MNDEPIRNLATLGVVLDAVKEVSRAPDGSKVWTDAEMDKRLRGLGIRLACAVCAAGVDWDYPESTVFAHVQPCERCRAAGGA